MLGGGGGSLSGGRVLRLPREPLCQRRQMSGTRARFLPPGDLQPAPLFPSRTCLHIVLIHFSKPENIGEFLSLCCRDDNRSPPVLSLHRWLYTGISRYKAIELLMLPNNQNGAFLVRESETTAGLSPRQKWNRIRRKCVTRTPEPSVGGTDSYSLSILRRSSSPYLNSVKHYRISCLQNGWVYISPRLTFPSLHHLVEHYSGLYRLDRAQRRAPARSMVKGRLSSQSRPTVCVVG